MTSNMRVPLSRCTFWVLEAITEPSVLFEAADVKLSPLSPNTPRLPDANCPAASRPPTAPVVEPAMLAVEPTAPLVVEVNRPPAVEPAVPIGSVAAPKAPPAVAPTPPPPPSIPRPDPDPDDM